MSARTSRYTGINAWLAASARASSRFGVQRARLDLDALPAPNDCSLIWFLSSRAVAVPPRSLRRGRTPNVIRSLLDGLGYHVPLDGPGVLLCPLYLTWRLWATWTPTRTTQARKRTSTVCTGPHTLACTALSRPSWPTPGQRKTASRTLSCRPSRPGTGGGRTPRPKRGCTGSPSTAPSLIDGEQRCVRSATSCT